MNAILSIKPEFAKKIFEGTKKYEYRRTIFKRKDIKKVIVYVSSPIKKIIGEFEIDDILYDNVDAIWQKTSHYSGITQEYYMDYFKNKENAYAIKIGKCQLYDTFKQLDEYGINFAPQSFVYVNEFK